MLDTLTVFELERLRYRESKDLGPLERKKKKLKRKNSKWECRM